MQFHRCLLSFLLNTLQMLTLSISKTIELLQVRIVLLSIEIDKSRPKSITCPSIIVIIDFYRHIKLVNRQLLTSIEYYRLIDLSDDRFLWTCYVLVG